MKEKHTVQEVVAETVEKLKGMTYSEATLVLEYIKREIKLNLTLN